MKFYLDDAATTKVDKKIFEKMTPYFLEDYANPSSNYVLGQRVRKVVEDSRKKIAKKINAKPFEIIFTSGGSESNNFAIKGLALANPNKKHILVSSIEHECTMQVCKFLSKKGYEIDYIEVNEEGIVDLRDLEKKIRKNTLLVSVMHINNEIGTIQPIEKISKICKKKKVYFHSDSVQSFCKEDIDVEKLGVDLLSASGHKANGPKGIGFLYIKEGLNISPIIHGGGQEFGLRGGTENVPGIIGLAEASSLKRKKSKAIRDFMIKELKKIRKSKINGSLKNRIYNNISISFYGVEGEALQMLLAKEGIYVSTGSACSSNKLEKSHVLDALGVGDFYINGTIRIITDSLNKKQAKKVVDMIKQKVEILRNISPYT